MHLKHRENEREQHKHDEAVVHFNALLADLVSHYLFIFIKIIKIDFLSINLHIVYFYLNKIILRVVF